MSIPRPLLAAFVLPLVVLLGFQSAWAAYACRSDGRVRDHCCCKPKKDQPSQEPRLASQGCCDVTIHAAPKAPPLREVAGSAPVQARVLVAAVMPAFVPQRVVQRVVTTATMARPPPRVPLFIDNQAILR